MADRYVSTTGGADTPAGAGGTLGWRTIAYALQFLMPGDTLHIRGGTYTGTANVIHTPLSLIRNGTDESNRITIRGYAGETVVLQPPAGYHAIKLNGQSYLTFRDFKIDGANGTAALQAVDAGNGVHVDGGSHHIRFQNLEVYDFVNNGFVCSDNNGASPFQEYLDCLIHDNGRDVGGGIANPGYGLYLACPDALVRGGSIYRNHGYGIHFLANAPNGCDRGQVLGVRIYENGPHLGGGVGGQTGAGIAVVNGEDMLIANCLIYRQGLLSHVTCDGHGVMIYTNAGVRLLNNSFDRNQGYDVFMQFYSVAPYLRNNIFSRARNGDTIDHGGTGSPDAASNNPSTIDPRYTDPDNGDFRLLTTSPARDTGADMAAYVTADFAGTTRPVGFAWDIGAYEYTPTVSGSTPGQFIGGWKLGQDYARACIAIDFTRMKLWMGGFDGQNVLEFDLPAMNTGDPSTWPRLLPSSTIARWWPTISGAVSTYANGLLWWQNKLWAAPRGFYAQGSAATEALTIYARTGESMTFPTLQRQKFSGFVKRGPGLDPYLGCGGYESGQGSQSGPSLATLAGQKLIEYQWPGDPGPDANNDGVPDNWNLRAPREPNYYPLNHIDTWLAWEPRLINGTLEGRWTTDFVFGGGLVLPSGITFWPFMGTGEMFYAQQHIPNPQTYVYRYDPSSFQLLDFTAAPEFGTGPVWGHELGPDGRVYLAHGNLGASSIPGPLDITLRVYEAGSTPPPPPTPTVPPVSSWHPQGFRLTTQLPLMVPSGARPGR